MSKFCSGPLIWYDVVGGEPEFNGITEDVTDALLACTRCDYIIVAGNINDDLHTRTVDLIHEGL